MKNGQTVAAFERAFAEYCGAEHAICAANGTVTLQAALVALGVKAGDRVATTPLTMAATTIAILNVGAVPQYYDVDEKTWLMRDTEAMYPNDILPLLPVSLYGLHSGWFGQRVVDDAAQTLRPHGGAAFTSLSFQRSKILNTGEGGALLTNDAGLAERARSYLSLGYRMNGQARIDSDALKSPTFDRHYLANSINGRMNDLTAAEGLERLLTVRYALESRRAAAEMYKDASASCEWLTWQQTPPGFTHDYWTFAVACDSPERAARLADAVVANGGERPFPCWRLTYHEPAFKHLAPKVEVAYDPSAWDGFGLRYSRCPVAESLQPRLLQFQTNSLASAEQNASALRKAIEELS